MATERLLGSNRKATQNDPKRLGDSNQLAKSIIDIATGRSLIVILRPTVWELQAKRRDPSWLTSAINYRGHSSN
jgi:hypothetical protein